MRRIRFQRELHFQVAQNFSPFKCVHDYQIEIQRKTKFVQHFCTGAKQIFVSLVGGKIQFNTESYGYIMISWG